MVEIGGYPILWHIMNIYAAHGFTEFIVALGYKGEVIKDYFMNYYQLNSNLTIDLGRGMVQVHDGQRPNWTIQLVDTGQGTQTGGRVKRLAPCIGHEPFMLTYGDAVGNINVAELAYFHRRHGKQATVTAVRPPARFGRLDFAADGRTVRRFAEKPQTGEGWINGGFFVMQPEVFDYLDSDDMILEREPLERLAGEGELVAFKHEGFWQPMDTLREKQTLEQLWSSGQAPWKVW
jgi:glucose-1-phosphate cytidylyltransferase